MTKKISLILLVFLTIVLSLWIWSFTASKNSIVLGGSTSVNPFMQKMTKIYFDNGKTDFVYNSTGSQAGVGGVEKTMYSAGFVSKKIKPETLSTGHKFKKLDCETQSCEVKNKDEFDVIKTNIINNANKEEKNNSYIGLEFAIDAIGVIFNSPTYWNEIGEQSNTSLNDLVDFAKKEDDNLSEIYAGNYTWEEFGLKLIKNDENKYLDLLEKIKNNSSASKKIVTFTREDGSGTRSAFSDITGIKSMPKSNVVNSNGSMIENIAIAPSIGYVSNAFLSQLSNESTVKLSGFNGKKLAYGENGKPQKFENGKWDEWTSENNDSNLSTNDLFIKDIYEFKRPFIAIFNTYNNLNQILDFFEFILTDSSNDSQKESAEKVFKDEGLVKNFEFNPLPVDKKI
ncbi:phosphate ABC transporter substrate-binding protein [Spiroplasma taiwanense]|uniref:Phosphate ABC transporter substrate-binding protein n=1 Tax=Spiroplasma taiwanense CT-1 TaxID=1276220 RepID=S5MCR6_9MOLU|nr:phosphate ABC transporter substrate-binding protein [Spiroplasma taiwanense]AGR41513.1 phosphate ABC transporter substrate-binding protein [Spiroplasma taiwanense CT-1]